MAIKEENLVENPEEVSECACQFVIDEGQPVVQCPDTESQSRAIQAMQEGDVLVRVNPVVDHDDGDHDEVDQAGDEVDPVGDDVDEPVELDDDDDHDDAEEED